MGPGAASWAGGSAPWPPGPLSSPSRERRPLRKRAKDAFRRSNGPARHEGARCALLIRITCSTLRGVGPVGAAGAPRDLVVTNQAQACGTKTKGTRSRSRKLSTRVARMPLIAGARARVTRWKRAGFDNERQGFADTGRCLRPQRPSRSAGLGCSDCGVHYRIPCQARSSPRKGASVGCWPASLCHPGSRGASLRFARSD